MEEQFEEQIDLGHIFKVLFRKLPIIAAVTVIFGLGAYIYSQWFMPPVYSTNVKLYVNNQQGVSESAKVQSSDVATSNTLVYGYVAMMKTDRVLEEVAMNTGLGYSTSQLSSMISAAGVDETPLFVVTVRSRVPEHAQTIANVVADVAPAVIQEVVKGSSAEIVDRAKLPRKPVSPKPGRVTLIGLAAGLLLSVVGVLLAERFDLRVKSAPQLTEKFGLPVLGKVNGDDGYDALKNNVRFSFTHQGCRRVAVTDTGDGAGKDGVAAKLAETLAKNGEKTLFIDGDMGLGGKPFGLPSSPGLSNILVGDAELRSAVKKNVRPSLDVICAGDIPPDPAVLLGCDAMTELVNGFKGEYGYIVISTPAVLDEAGGAILKNLCDGTVAVVRGRRTGTDRIKTVIDATNGGGARLLGFVYNSAKKRPVRKEA